MQLRHFTETLSLTPKQWVQGKILFLQEEIFLQDQQTKSWWTEKRRGEERKGLKARQPILLLESKPVKQHSGKVLQLLQLGWSLAPQDLEGQKKFLYIRAQGNRSCLSSRRSKITVMAGALLKEDNY